MTVFSALKIVVCKRKKEAFLFHWFGEKHKMNWVANRSDVHIPRGKTENLVCVQSSQFTTIWRLNATSLARSAAFIASRSVVEELLCRWITNHCENQCNLRRWFSDCERKSNNPFVNSCVLSQRTSCWREMNRVAHLLHCVQSIDILTKSKGGRPLAYLTAFFENIYARDFQAGSPLFEEFTSPQRRSERPTIYILW